MKIWALAIFLFCLIDRGNAQAPHENFWGLAVGLRQQGFQDQLVTQVRYNGVPFYLMINKIKTKNDTWRNFILEGSIGKLKSKEFQPVNGPSRYMPPAVNSYWNEVSYSYLFRLSNFAPGNFYIGPGISHIISMRVSPRWDNSQFNYEFSGNLQAEAKFSRSFQFLSKEMKASIILKIPVIGYIARPSYGGVPDFLNLENKFINSLYTNTHVSWVGNFPRIQFDNYVEFPIANDNRIQLIYNWEYYSFQSPNKVQTSAHTLAVNFLMKTK